MYGKIALDFIKARSGRGWLREIDAGDTYATMTSIVPQERRVYRKDEGEMVGGLFEVVGTLLVIAFLLEAHFYHLWKISKHQQELEWGRGGGLAGDEHENVDGEGGDKNCCVLGEGGLQYKWGGNFRGCWRPSPRQCFPPKSSSLSPTNNPKHWQGPGRWRRSLLAMMTETRTRRKRRALKFDNPTHQPFSYDIDIWTGHYRVITNYLVACYA